MRVSDIAGVKTQAVLTRKRETVGPASQNQAVDEQHLAGQEPKWLCRAHHCDLCVIETLKSTRYTSTAGPKHANGHQAHSRCPLPISPRELTTCTGMA